MFVKFSVSNLNRLSLCLVPLWILCLAQLSFAQGYQIPEGVGTPRVKPTPGTYSQTANIDQFGNLMVVPGVSGTPQPVSGTVNVVATPGATSFLKNEDSAHTSGDAGTLGLGVYQASPGNLVNTDGDYAPFSTNGVGAVVASIYRSGASTDPVKAEDSAAASGDAGVGILAKRQDTFGNQTNQDGDYAIPSTNAFSILYTQPVGFSLGGSTTYSKISTADNNSTNIKASAGTIYSIQASNLNAAVRYLKLYNKATEPTCGTDKPVLRIAIPPSSAAGTPITFPTGAAFSAGIGICIVTGITDADNTATAASEQLVNIAYN